MIITEKSKVVPFEHHDIEEQDLGSLYIPASFSFIIPHLTRLGDTVYYYKSATTKSMINELIGSYLAKRIGLDSVDYEIGRRESDKALFALSKIFFEEGYQYQYARQFLEEQGYKNGFNMLGNPVKLMLPCYYHLRTLKLYKGTSFYNSCLKLIAVDLKMAQHDRHRKNLQIKIDSRGTIDLAPIYDYGRAYSVNFDLAYGNPFAFIRYTESTLDLLFRRYPDLRDYVFFLNKIDMEEILRTIEREKHIQFTSQEKREYGLEQQNIDSLIDKVRVKRYI